MYCFPLRSLGQDWPELSQPPKPRRILNTVYNSRSNHKAYHIGTQEIIYLILAIFIVLQMVPHFVPLLQYLGHTQITHICHSQSNLVKLISSLAAVPFQVSGFALPSMHRSNSPHLKCPISETSATALRGTTANYSKEILKSNGNMKKQRWEESERRK